MNIDNSTRLDAHFNSQQPFYDGIYAGESVEIPDTAFDVKDGERIVGCMDEGTADRVHIATPGSFILDGEEKAARMLQGKGVGTVTSHPGCAAAKAAMKMSGKYTNITQKDIDEFAATFSRRLAEKIGAKHEDIPLHRPSNFHIARGAVYDGSRGAIISDPNKGGMIVGNNFVIPPPMFRINRKHLGPERAISAMGLSASIATSDHSFAERISKENPFVVFALGHPTEKGLSSDALEKELQDIQFAVDGTRATLIEYFGSDIIKIVKLNAPQYTSRHNK
ncbi:hypothetical protein M0P48_02515 [Candidatus Gracilibacteria bacterium]|nr:hypothetical protein [Candidatus Gracilibacteria bacterium]